MSMIIIVRNQSTTTTPGINELIMSNNQIERQPMSPRAKVLSVEKRKSQCTRRAARSTVSICCADCKLPLLIDVNTRKTSNKSRAVSKLQTEPLCRECTQEKTKNGRKPSGRLVKSASINWTNMGNNIETWFEKAQTPDQQVVYNFLQQINKQNENPTTTEKAPVNDLDDILKDLKKYQTRFNSARTQNKLTRCFESSSWRVLRRPVKYSQSVYGNESRSGAYDGSIFYPTDRRIGSTYLIHPDWI